MRKTTKNTDEFNIFVQDENKVRDFYAQGFWASALVKICSQSPNL